MLDCEAAYSQLGLTMHWSAEAQCIKVADKVLTQLLDVVLLPGDVQQEQVRLSVLGEYLLLYPGELLGVLHDLLQTVDHDLLGLLQGGRELDAVLPRHQRDVNHRGGEEHHVVVLPGQRVPLLNIKHTAN